MRDALQDNLNKVVISFNSDFPISSRLPNPQILYPLFKSSGIQEPKRMHPFPFYLEVLKKFFMREHCIIYRKILRYTTMRTLRTALMLREFLQSSICAHNIYAAVNTRSLAFLSVKLSRPSFEVTTTDGVKNNGFYLSTLLCY